MPCWWVSKYTSIATEFLSSHNLQLGGKNAAIIFDDADLEKCVPTTVRFA